MIDTNFNNTEDVVVGNDGIVHEVKITDDQLNIMLSADMDTEVWKEIAKLAIMQIKMGLKESIKAGIYNDQVVKTAMSAMKQANKTFDEGAAKELSESLKKFRAASSKTLKAHKEKAIAAAIN